MAEPISSSIVNDATFLVLPRIKPSCGPLFFTHSLAVAAGNVSANGSFGLVNTGKKKLLVTCYHVLEEFRELTSEKPDLMLCVALTNVPEVLNLKNLIDENKQLDLASFDMEPMLSACEGREFFQVNCEHIHRVRKGDKLAFVGYPGRNRIETERAIFWGTTPHLLIAEDVSNYSMVAKTSRVMNLDRELLSERYENPYGGISGSPCFLVQKYSSVELVAFVTEHLNDLQIMKFTSLNCLKSDGTFRN
jgi:hypothetical protein